MTFLTVATSVPPKSRDEPLYKPWPGPFMRKLIIVLMFLMFAATVVLIVLRFGDAATASEQKDLSKAQLSASQRNDCQNKVLTARRSVFDDVNIYNAILVRAAAYRAINGELPPGTTVETFVDVNQKLAEILPEATRLQPPAVLNGVIENGGVINGVYYSPCPTIEEGS